MKNNTDLPIKSWCKNLDENAMKQAVLLSRHPKCVSHIALMPDCHLGYGIPIGGVIACENAVIPNAVGVDIGCGMVAVKSDFNTTDLKGKNEIRNILTLLKENIPLGEGKSHKVQQSWKKLDTFFESNTSSWTTKEQSIRDLQNLGTLGGGNHFIELQKSEDNTLWLMIHSGSRNLGYRIADFYHKLALHINNKNNDILPSDDLAWLSDTSDEGLSYIRDMNLALSYALENRSRMMTLFKRAVTDVIGNITFSEEINIHHNYAAMEKIDGKQLWIHRKGATSAQKGEWGIIPGSMGTSSYIVKGLGNKDSFNSCSHGAGRVMGRNAASKKLTVEECNNAMKGVVFDPWKWKKKKKLYDLSEAPQAYKNIDQVMDSQKDLVKPIVKLSPLGVLKG